MLTSTTFASGCLGTAHVGFHDFHFGLFSQFTNFPSFFLPNSKIEITLNYD